MCQESEPQGTNGWLHKTTSVIKCLIREPHLVLLFWSSYHFTLNMRVWADGRTYLVKLARAWTVFAMRVRHLDVFSLGYSWMSSKRLGDMMAGHRNLRNIQPLQWDNVLHVTSRYGVSQHWEKRICATWKLINTIKSNQLKYQEIFAQYKSKRQHHLL